MKVVCIKKPIMIVQHYRNQLGAQVDFTVGEVYNAHLYLIYGGEELRVITKNNNKSCRFSPSFFQNLDEYLNHRLENLLECE